jgi:hypothetical protein
MIRIGTGRQERTSFSEEKEAKKLSVLRAVAMTAPTPPGAKVFLVTPGGAPFFSKKVTPFFRLSFNRPCSSQDNL